MIRSLIKKVCGGNGQKSQEKYFTYNLAIIIIMYIIAGLYLFKLPDRIPIMHDGPKQIYVDSYLGVFLIPTIALLTNVLFAKQNRLFFTNTIVYVVVLVGMSIYYYTLI